MRRTITLILLLLYSVFSIQALDNPIESEPDKNIKRNLSEKLKKLKEVAVKRQPQQRGKAKRLNDEIVETMKELFPTEEAFASEDQIKKLSEVLPKWKKTALDSKEIPRGELVQAIQDADSEYARYPSALQKPQDVDRGDDTKRNATPTLASLDAKFEDLRKQVEAERNIIPQWLSLGILAAGPLLAVGLFALAFIGFNKMRRDLGDTHHLTRESIITLKNKQNDLVKQFEGLGAADTDLFTRLAELSQEIGAVSTRVQALQPDDGGGSDGGGEFLSVPEPPPFPTSADAYLRKMQRHATVVKRDFQNGILVTDVENSGELVLVEDTILSSDAPFIIPRATQFQMKQDFYTYYERYYDCDRPASGTVWIVKPAIVERVQDGWILRTKGVLEVR